jgi:hypothetical protein
MRNPLLTLNDIVLEGDLDFSDHLNRVGKIGGDDIARNKVSRSLALKAERSLGLSVLSAIRDGATADIGLTAVSGINAIGDAAEELAAVDIDALAPFKLQERGPGFLTFGILVLDGAAAENAVG